MTARRTFLGTLAAGAVLGTLPTALMASPTAPPSDWDLTWVNRIKGKYRALFDVPEVDSGYGVWRATIWQRQYADVLGAKPADMTAVVVLRHNGIALAMNQAFWDKYGVSTDYTVLHPITEEKTDRNPVLLSSSRNEVPPMLDDVALDKLIARGGIALACNLAFDDVVAKAAKRSGETPEAVRKVALASFVPGVILQPSGVFAALHAQDAGNCSYLRAS